MNKNNIVTKSAKDHKKIAMSYLTSNGLGFGGSVLGENSPYPIDNQSNQGKIYILFNILK